jgi:hypothetical protein
MYRFPIKDSIEASMKFLVFGGATIALAFMSGCQLVKPKAASETPSSNECFIEAESLYQFLDDEHTYILADRSQKQAMIKGLENEPARQANLYSSDTTNPVYLRKALGLYKQLPLLPSKSCYADRYLYLRFRHAQANLKQLEAKEVVSKQYINAKKATEKLQEQIDALTEIEQAITRQREEH